MPFPAKDPGVRRDDSRWTGGRIRIPVGVAGVLLAGLLLAACGKKGDLEPPSGIASPVPRTYPAPLPVPQPDTPQS